AYQLLAGQDSSNRASGWGLPRVYSCRMEQGCCVVEEEYIDGISLQELIDGGEKMSAQRAVSITSSLCRTLLHLHRNGIIHRDVKPEHLMLTPEGKLYLIDLDAAMRILPDKKSDTRLLGTAVYAAPEQFGLTRSDVRTDIFAVGILLNLLLTGEHPAVVRCREGKLAEIIGKCTEMNPQDRYQDMPELLAALEDAAAEEPEASGATETSEASETSEIAADLKRGGRLYGRKKRLAIIGALCLVILLGAALVPGMDLLAGGDSWEDGVSEAVLELDDSALVDEKYIICTKTEENHYVPLPVSRNGYAGNETPAMFFLGEYTDRTFYLLSRNQAERLELRILDSRRYMTLEKAAAAVTRKGNVLAGGQEYAVWQVKIEEDFTGAVRTGFSFNGVLANYDTEGGSGRQTKYMWILDEDCQRYDFSDGYDGSLIPCAENPA
ncbi:MAG: serine/threonine-protein kinase, partial [Anaerovoracaceae bacterium]